MIQPSLLDWQPAKQARDQALATVEGNSEDWMLVAIIECRELAKQNPGMELTGEKLRHMLAPVMWKPSSQNIYGALVMRLVKLGILEKTGCYAQMTDPQSHSRETKVYRFVAVS